MGSDARLEPLVLAPITLLLAHFLHYFSLKTSDVPDIPVLNARKGASSPCLRAIWRNTFDHKSALILHGKEQHKNQAMRVPILGPGKMILLLAAESRWLID